MKKGRLGFAAAALAIVMSVSGCGSGGASNGASVQTTTAAPAVSADTSAPSVSADTAQAASDATAGAPVTIGYMSWNGGAQEKDEEAFFAQYEKDHPNITINAQYLQWADYYSKLNTLMAAGSCPDIYFTAESQLIDYADKGMAIDLQPLFAADGINMTDYFAPGCYYQSSDGKIWSLSNGISAIVMYYNKGLFSQMGITPPPLDATHPWTFDQYREAAKELTTDANGKHPDDSGFDPNNIKTYGTIAPIGRNALIPLLYSNNATMLISSSGNPTGLGLDSPEAKTVLQAVADQILVDHSAPTAAIAGSLPAANQMFKDNQLGMQFDGAWMYANFQDNGVDVGVAPVPMFQKPASVFWGSAYMLSSQSKNQAIAFQVMKDFQIGRAHV